MTTPIPEGHQTLVPHLTVDGAAKAIEFYQKAFGATLAGKPSTHDGKVLHAALKIGDCMLFINDPFGGPATTPAGFTINICTANADAMFERAVAAGAEPAMPLMDAFWGDRYGKLTDPFGHSWAVSTRIKDMTAEEVAEAAAAFFADFKGF